MISKQTESLRSMSSNNITSLGVFPTHPYFHEQLDIRKGISLTSEIKYCVDDYIQMMQFWRFNSVSTNGISNESLNTDSIENPDTLKEYLFSLLDVPKASHNGTPFFADDLLSSSLNIKKRKLGVIKKTIKINPESSKNRVLLNDEDTTVSESKDASNDTEILDGDGSEIDYEYMDSGANEDYDELEDNSNDNDII